MRKLILFLGLAIFASMGQRVDAQVTCSPDVPHDICKSADQFFQTTTQHDPVRIEVLTPDEFRKRHDSYAKETSLFNENCDCFNALKPRLMVNTYDSEEIMLLRDKPGGVHVSEVLISFEAFYGFDGSKATTTDGIFHLSHNDIFDASQMRVISAYVEGYTDALRYIP